MTRNAPDMHRTTRVTAHAAASPGQVTGLVERLVIGGDVGADGYTTVEQADEIANVLGLRLLDAGTGKGWPGVYLACNSRVVRRRLPICRAWAYPARRPASPVTVWLGHCTVVAASGGRLPFTAATFHAVVHTDVLCCLRAKLSVLKECRRVLRPRGSMAFHTIHVPPGLPESDRRHAVRCGPPAVATRSDYHNLLRSAGLVDVDEVDLTPAYLHTARAWLRREQQFATELAAAESPGAVDERLARRQAAVTAIEAGLLRRSLFVVTRPWPGTGRAASQKRQKTTTVRT